MLMLFDKVWGEKDIEKKNMLRDKELYFRRWIKQIYHFQAHNNISRFNFFFLTGIESRYINQSILYRLQ